MKASKESYEKVARHCSEFHKNQSSGCKNSTCNSEEVSCLNCTHFDKDNYCNLNLFDQIMNKHNF